MAVAGFVPCAAFGIEDLGARVVVTAFVIRADHRDAGELALGAGHRRERYGAHAGDVFQNFLQLVEAAHEALTVRLGRERMAAEEARQVRGAMRAARVVLHRARAERIELRLDGEVAPRQIGVVAHRLQFGDFRHRRRLRSEARRRNTGQ